MVRPADRRIMYWLVRLGLWRLVPTLMRQVHPRPRWGTAWLYQLMLKRQSSDGLHHAPCCPGNEWAGMVLVWRSCNCGAVNDGGEQ